MGFIHSSDRDSRHRLARHGHPTDDERSAFRKLLHEVTFGADTRAWETFDMALMVPIFLSVITVLVESAVSV
jgi:hypothetical protein